MMRNYGLLLEDFLNNGDYVNDCILTMMHHVSGDLSQVAVLFQPSILCSLSGIWESDYALCDVSLSLYMTISSFLVSKLFFFINLIIVFIFSSAGLV